MFEKLWINKKKKTITLSQLLSFSGVTSEVTGFTFDPGVMIIGAIIMIAIQLVKDSAEENEANRENEKKANGA